MTFISDLAEIDMSGLYTKSFSILINFVNSFPRKKLMAAGWSTENTNNIIEKVKVATITLNEQ